MKKYLNGVHKIEIKLSPLNILKNFSFLLSLFPMHHLLHFSFSFSFSTSISIIYSPPQLQNTTNMKVCMCNNSKKFFFFPKKIFWIVVRPGSVQHQGGPHPGAASGLSGGPNPVLAPSPSPYNAPGQSRIPVAA